MTTQREKLRQAERKLRAVEALIPKLERSRSTAPIAEQIKVALGLPVQDALF